MAGPDGVGMAFVNELFATTIVDMRRRGPQVPARLGQFWPAGVEGEV